MLTGSPGRALLHIAARLSSASNMSRLPPTTTRSWGRRSWVLLSRRPAALLSGLRLPQHRPALTGAGAGLVPEPYALSPAGLAGVGGVRMTRASSPAHRCVRQARWGDRTRAWSWTELARPFPRRARDTPGPPVKAQRASTDGHRLLGAPGSCSSAADPRSRCGAAHGE